MCMCLTMHYMYFEKLCAPLVFCFLLQFTEYSDLRHHAVFIDIRYIPAYYPGMYYICGQVDSTVIELALQLPT